MKILAIDTSSKNACVTIMEDEKVLINLNNEDEKTHSQKLMPMIDSAFKNTNVTLNDIGLIVCSLGPGSFTGVRIGIATAKAFVDSKNMPAVGVTSLESLAYNLNKEGYICSLINANHENVYAGFFYIVNENGILQTKKSELAFLSLSNTDKNTTDANIVTSNNSNLNLISFINKNVQDDSPIYFVGDGAIVYENILQNLFEGRKIFIEPRELASTSGITLAKIGYTKFKNGSYGNSYSLSPVYLRKSQAELSLEK